jgi:hypothetical protein
MPAFRDDDFKLGHYLDFWPFPAYLGFWPRLAHICELKEIPLLLQKHGD